MNLVAIYLGFLKGSNFNIKHKKFSQEYQQQSWKWYRWKLLKVTKWSHVEYKWAVFFNISFGTFRKYRRNFYSMTQKIQCLAIYVYVSYLDCLNMLIIFKFITMLFSTKIVVSKKLSTLSLIIINFLETAIYIELSRIIVCNTNSSIDKYLLFIIT